MPDPKFIPWISLPSMCNQDPISWPVHDILCKIPDLVLQIQDLFQTLSHEEEILTISRSGNSKTEQRKKKMEKGKRDGRVRKIIQRKREKGRKMIKQIKAHHWFNKHSKCQIWIILNVWCHNYAKSISLYINTFH